MSTLQHLKDARSLISKPGGWGINQMWQDNGLGGVAYCAMGAVYKVTVVGIAHPFDFDAYNQALDCLRRALLSRYYAGTLPTKPCFGSGGGHPKSWDSLLTSASGVAQFNNSTSQAEVIGLFDDAIALAERELAPPTPEKVEVARELELA